jgi:hypothetical protein
MPGIGRAGGAGVQLWPAIASGDRALSAIGAAWIR